MIATAMNEQAASQTSVLATLTARLGALDAERAVLAARVHDLEAQVEAARAEAERCASEALHIEGLIAFYEKRPDGEVLPEAGAGPELSESEGHDEDHPQAESKVA